MYKILIVDKVTKFDTLTNAEFNMLTPEHRERIKKADFEHKQTMSEIKNNSAIEESSIFFYIDDNCGSVKCELIFMNVNEIKNDCNFNDIDVFVSIGGDGTALFLAKFIKNQPLISINSNPDTSVGRICQYKINSDNKWLLFITNVERAIKHIIWKKINADKSPWESLSIPRLQLLIGGNEKGVFLNDALFTNENPAEMSIYNLDFSEKHEKQHSSGLWISTGMGSTGGINSAGVTPIDKQEKVFLWKTREPYEGHGRCWYSQGHLYMPTGKIVLTSMCKGMHFYLDGSHNKIPLDIGEKATILSYQHPLNLF